MSLLANLFRTPPLRRIIGKMIEEAKVADAERRENGRWPYFQPVMVQLQNSPEFYSAFTRDISDTGIGLLHWMPMEPQVISILNHLSTGETVRLSVKIAWCVSCGEGWYISGGRFLSVEDA